jgi:hypothetical protein
MDRNRFVNLSLLGNRFAFPLKMTAVNMAIAMMLNQNNNFEKST